MKYLFKYTFFYLMLAVAFALDIAVIAFNVLWDFSFPEGKKDFVCCRFVFTMQELGMALKKHVDDNTELKVLETEHNIIPSHGHLYYDQLSKTIGLAFWGAGTDAAAIIAVFDSLQNDADFIKLEMASAMYDIPIRQRIYSEMSSRDIQAINDSLRKKGLKKQL